MNIEEIKLLSEPNAANMRMLHEYNKQYVAKSKALYTDVIQILGRPRIQGALDALEEQEMEMKRFEVVLEAGDQFWLSACPRIRTGYARMHTCMINQEENYISSKQAFDRMKLELIDLYRPPLLSEIITRLVVSPRQADRVIDCRAEAFTKHCAKHGRARATYYHWADTLKSSWPTVKRWIPFAAAFDLLRRWFGS